ncbi:XdhC family protein [Sphingomonas sp. OTU376]|uniref:XdhC family protein n=1 Tax=Sphingomonas sp. OTU376 TaxID=3043863 RepID=UPI00313D3184
MAELDILLERARQWAGSPLALATVLQTWGSAPRPVGSHMLVRADGAFEGSVSGGCVENDVLFTAMRHALAGGSSRHTFGVADEAGWQHGLPCGGTIEILVQAVRDDCFPQGLFSELAASRAGRTEFATSTDLSTGRTHAGIRPGSFINVYRPRRRMLIVGAVQIAQALSRFARELDFDVSIIDPRTAYLTAERFPGMRRMDQWPDEAIRAARPDTSTAVVTLSHDSKIDDPALIAALAFPTGYVAALGSERSHRARLDRLRQHGLREGALRQIEGPAGVPLGGRGVADIALSIAAGAVRRLSEAPDLITIGEGLSGPFPEPVPLRAPACRAL